MAWPKGVSRKDFNAARTAVAAGDAGALVEASAESTHQEKASERSIEDAAFKGIKNSGDPKDREMVAAMYDETYSRQSWQKSKPNQIPADVLAAMPNKRFRWRAVDEKAGTLRRGNHYDGWQKYTSKKYPNGLWAGGKLVLCFQPEAQAVARNERYEEESSQGLRDKQTESIELMEAAKSQSSAKYGRITGEGIQLGAESTRNKKTGVVVRAYRGLSPKDFELMKKDAEKSRGRAYSFPSPR